MTHHKLLRLIRDDRVAFDCPCGVLHLKGEPDSSVDLILLHQMADQGLVNLQTCELTDAGLEELYDY